MSLRTIGALMIICAVLLVPFTTSLLLIAFPPPLPAWPARLEARPEGIDSRRPPGPPGANRPGTWIAPSVRATQPIGRQSAVRPVRNHFLLLSGISLLLVASLFTLLFAKLLRRPFAALEGAIADIERGRPPPGWAFGGPSEIRTIGSALVSMGRQVHDNLRERELMLAGLSHDLRSPLARIQAALQLRELNGDDWHHTLQEIDDIDRILGQCMAYARDGSDEPCVQRSVDQVITDLLRNMAQPPGLQAAAPARLTLRPRSLSRALLNLIENARHHGAEPVCITTHCSNDTVSIRVSDAGPGIHPDAWPHLLAPFSRSDPARARAGAGLGLTIANRVARQHGGGLRMHRASPSGGFAVELWLPRHPGPDKVAETL